MTAAIKWTIRLIVQTVVTIFVVPFFAMAYLGFWTVEVIDWAFEGEVTR